MRIKTLVLIATVSTAVLAPSATAARTPVIADATGDANGLATVGQARVLPAGNQPAADLASVDLTMPQRDQLELRFKVGALPRQDDTLFHAYMVDLKGPCRFSIGVLTGGGNAKPVAFVDPEPGCHTFEDDERIRVIREAIVEMNAGTQEIVLRYSLPSVRAAINKPLGPGALLREVGARVVSGGGYQTHEGLGAAQGGDRDVWAGLVLDAASGADFTLECTHPEGC